MGFRQMGQREEVCGVGGGTVRIGRPEVDEIGGEGLEGSGGDAGDGEDLVARYGCCGAGEDRETVFVGSLGSRDWCWVFLGAELDDEGVFWTGMPDITGGGRSSPSAALRDNCLAKSEACHHSRNLRAKIEVGRRSRRLESNRGYITEVKVVGFQMLFVCPGRFAALDGG